MAVLLTESYLIAKHCSPCKCSYVIFGRWPSSMNVFRMRSVYSPLVQQSYKCHELLQFHQKKKVLEEEKGQFIEYCVPHGPVVGATHN